MRRNSCLLVFIASLALFLALAVVLWMGFQRPAVQTVTLADGSRLVLEAVTSGTVEHVHGSPWQRVLYTLLPPNQKELSGSRVFSGAPGKVTFWVTRPGSGAAPIQIHAAPFDEHGCMGPTVTPQGLGNDLERYELTAYPRRGQVLGLRFFQRAGDQWKPLGQVQVPNPSPGPHPTWPAQPLPQTQRAGEVEATLQKLTAGVKQEEIEQHQEPGQMLCMAHLTVRVGGKPSGAWSPSIAELSEASGNTWHNSSTTYLGEAGNLRLFFTSLPWPDDPVWKVRVQLTRTPTARFTPEELWIVKDIPIPAPGKVLPLGRKSTVQGVAMELVEVLGANTPPPASLDFAELQKHPQIIIHAPPSLPRDVHRMPIRAIDERGRDVPVQFTSGAGNDKGNTDMFRLETSPDARRVTLFYAVQKVRYVEFIAPRALREPRQK